MTERRRVAILISGRGSNMRALIEAAQAPDYPARIVGVLSSDPQAEGLALAAAAGVATASRAHGTFASREAFEAAIELELLGWRAEIVCLAGFMRILSPGFVERWRGRILNIHPSLLPAFRGLDTHRRAVAEGADEHGCTVHFVTPGLDEGPAILEARVKVLPGDTADSLAARVLIAEHRIYPLALAMVARGAARLDPSAESI